MKRLAKENLNTPTTHQIKEPDWFDVKRYKALYKYVKNGSVLDLGAYMKAPWQYFSSKSGKIKYIPLDWVPEKLSFKNGEFDYVVVGQLLEHVENPAEILGLAFRVLRSGGILSLSVPLEETGAGEVDKIHVWSFSKEDIEDLLFPYGKVWMKILRSQYFPWYRYHFPHIVAWCKKM